MTSRRFSTDDVPARERLDYWREAICDVFVQLDCRSANAGGFYGHVTSEPLERLHLSDVRAERQHVVRGRRQLAKAREDDFLLSVQLDGMGVVRQDGRDAALQPGAMALYASTRPYELIFPQRFRQLVVQLPRTLLGASIANPDVLTARTLDAGLPETRLLRVSLSALAGDAAALSPGSRTHVAASVVQSLAAALATLPNACVGGSVERSASAARARICAYVEARLDDPNLAPATVAAALGYSRGHVHRLFAGEAESLERYIWRLRLERARSYLAEPALAGIPIAELAARSGFASAEHFSRAFRARYGTTAAAHRRAAHTGPAPS